MTTYLDYETNRSKNESPSYAWTISKEFPKIIPLTLVISSILKQNEQTKGPIGAKKLAQY